jgi:hypothetical protein
MRFTETKIRGQLAKAKCAAAFEVRNRIADRRRQPRRPHGHFHFSHNELVPCDEKPGDSATLLSKLHERREDPLDQSIFHPVLSEEYAVKS